MTGLLTRLQDASEGSRELDAAIHMEDGWTLGDIGPGQRGWIRYDGQTGLLPHYTTSIDAALTLVPEGHNLDCLTTGDPDTMPSNPARFCRAIVRPNLKNDAGWQSGGGVCRTAPTPALALCIAALKAQQSKAEVA